MSTFTVTSRITGRTEVTHTLDLSGVNPCKVHGRLPRVFEIRWGSGRRHQRGATAECESEDCKCFEMLVSDVLRKWNRVNPPQPAGA